MIDVAIKKPKTDESILMLTDFGTAIYTGRFVNGVFYECDLTKYCEEDLNELPNPVTQWMYVKHILDYKYLHGSLIRLKF